MPTKRSKYIKILVPKIHEALGMDLSSPIDMRGLVKRIGGKITYTSEATMPHEAYIKKDGDRFTIVLRRGYETRERFSIAHGIGHLFLHMGYLVDSDRFSKLNDGHSYDEVPSYHIGKSEEEYEANEFAAELVMPRQQFYSEVRNHTTGPVCNLINLSKRFGVSRQAAATRGRWLGLFEWE